MSNQTTTIPITGTLSAGLGLMYLDPISETLKEIDVTSMYIPVYPFESVVRRFYLCGDALFLDSVIIIKVSVDTAHQDDYDVKILAGQENPRLSDFDTADNKCVTSYGNINNYFANAIPVDILLSSNLRSESAAQLNININATNT